MDLIDALSDLCKDVSQPIIAIDGPAGAGKTTLAHDVKLALAQRYSITEIHMDDLYDGWDNALTSQLTDVLTHLVSAHKDTKPISLSTYNWLAGEFNQASEIEKSELLILEESAADRWLFAIHLQRSSGLISKIQKAWQGF